jgi:hypothetical protein
MSSGKQPGGKNGPATVGHIANLERRLLTSENFCRSMAIGKQSGDKNGTAGHVANLECRLLTSENFCRSMSNGKQPGGKNGPATAGHIANLERRLLTSEAAERRVHTELMKACERAETAERSAAQSRQLEEQMQVLALASISFHPILYSLLASISLSVKTHSL